MSTPSRFTRLRTRWKTLLVLGPRRRRRASVPSSLKNAEKIVFVKRDNIGDFILASTFMNAAYEYLKGKKVVLVCRHDIASMARWLYPEWEVRGMDPSFDENNNYRRSKYKKLKKEVRSWEKADCMVSLRTYRHNTEAVFESWIPAGRKIAIRNLMRNPGGRFELRDDEIYDEILATRETPVGDGISQDIENYHNLLDYCFPESAPHDHTRPAFPARLSFPDEQWEPLAHKAGIASDERYLMLAPFPSRNIRLYPHEKMALAASEIARRNGLSIVITGGADDEIEGKQLTDLIDKDIKTISVVGRLSMLEWVHMISRAAGVLGVESGGSHIAVAFGVPSVFVIGGGHYGVFAPWGSNTSVQWVHNKLPCYRCDWNCTRPQADCIREISPESVIEAFSELRPAR